MMADMMPAQHESHCNSFHAACDQLFVEVLFVTTCLCTFRVGPACSVRCCLHIYAVQCGECGGVIENWSSWTEACGDRRTVVARCRLRCLPLFSAALSWYMRHSVQEHLCNECKCRKTYVIEQRTKFGKDARKHPQTVQKRATQHVYSLH